MKVSSEDIQTIKDALEDIQTIKASLEEITKLLGGEHYDSPGFIVKTNHRLEGLESKFSLMCNIIWALGSGFFLILLEKIVNVMG